MNGFSCRMANTAFLFVNNNTYTHAEAYFNILTTKHMDRNAARRPASPYGLLIDYINVQGMAIGSLAHRLAMGEYTICLLYPVSVYYSIFYFSWCSRFIVNVCVCVSECGNDCCICASILVCVSYRPVIVQHILYMCLVEILLLFSSWSCRSWWRTIFFFFV
jgi:hypothetical protein